MVFTLVDINVLKLAIHKLKVINWVYKNHDDQSLDHAAKKVVCLRPNFATSNISSVHTKLACTEVL